MVANALAIVPPENPPFMTRTRPRTWRSGTPKRRTASSCRNTTPRSKGMESKPHEKTMRAPLARAGACSRGIICAIQTGSPQRSR